MLLPVNCRRHSNRITSIFLIGMTDQEKDVALSLPGEWALKKLLGPVFDDVGVDLGKLYAAGRDRIVGAATRKTKNIDDGKRANLRIARDIFNNGAFSDSEISAEYFGGLLASARSEDGKDDGSIYYLEIIKSMSSAQMKLHYLMYAALNEHARRSPEMKKINVGLEQEVRNLKVHFKIEDIIDLGIAYDRDPEVLYRLGIASEYRYETFERGQGGLVGSIQLAASTLGIQLFAVAFNKIAEWKSFTRQEFDRIDGLVIPNSSTDGENWGLPPSDNNPTP